MSAQRRQWTSPRVQFVTCSCQKADSCVCSCYTSQGKPARRSIGISGGQCPHFGRPLQSPLPRDIVSIGLRCVPRSSATSFSLLSVLAPQMLEVQEVSDQVSLRAVMQ